MPVEQQLNVSGEDLVIQEGSKSLNGKVTPVLPVDLFEPHFGIEVCKATEFKLSLFYLCADRATLQEKRQTRCSI